MIAELGHFSLILTLFVALAQGCLALAGAARGNDVWIAFARPAARAQFLLIIVSFATLGWSFIVKDFSVAYVAQNSNSQLPLLYRIAAVWGGHEESLLLWLLMQTGRSEEHTSELQSLMLISYDVFCVKKKNK